MTNKNMSRRNFLSAAKTAFMPLAITDGGASVSTKAIPQFSIQSPLIDEQGYTPTNQFYRQQLQSIPQVTSVYWALRIYGLVENTITLTYKDLFELPSAERGCTLSCIGSSPHNLMIGNALWKGVPLSAFLDRVKPSQKGAYAQFYSTDGYTTYLETTKLTDAILAYEMNGEALTREHGYPARLIVPGLYGYKMPKWIQRIEFTDSPQPGFWEKRGWSVTGNVQTTSAILSPNHQEIVNGNMQIGGVAYAGARLITKIEVSINDAPWMPIPIQKSQPYQWTPWHIEWQAPAPGDYLIKVRASDNLGFTQTEGTSTFPNGPTSVQSIVVRVDA
jgi:DMSO/TMAO reductase YedYZ molybdopterin-dependent catalytic subunit